ncbi:ABC transporter permease [Microbacterium telephonicum]|uniref:Carbohydrate ABC transporter membrane protein 1 (CUT1 family) n=1 Tax=Microbacterium telephonicum TaxID=1714841 RepID=A0A498CBT4_9MICO|nr:ABC transporter permease subunit [Microbacterium telephonicum]RLK52657.1 carbohydrate ABC transporter membrane protein 1 (CUT1 family) [Microbacterium telephonicum]
MTSQAVLTEVAASTIEEGAEQKQRRRGARKPREAGGKKSFVMFLCILPFIVLVFLFAYFPLYGWIYSLYDYKPALGLEGSEFVGLQWFQLLVSSPTQMQQIGQVLINTLAISFLGIATSVLPLAFAIFLNEVKAPWFRNSVQTLTTLPNFISWVLVYMIAFSLFSSSGLVNNVLGDWGLITAPIKFLDTDQNVWLTMTLWSIWKGLGWGAIIYLAAISGIDQALYESAEIDGAGRFQKMWYITVPQLMPTYLVLLLLSIANLLNNGMEQYYVFQNAFNKQYIQVLDLYVYNIGMTGNSLSMATAIGMLKSIISVILLLTVNAIAKRVRGQSIV